MSDFRSRLPRRRTVFRVISISVLVIFVVVTAMLLYVYKTSVGHFQLRRLSLPTRIYADYVPLQAGAAVGTDELLEKLDRLGYRKVEKLTQPGDYVPAKGSIDIHTRPFEHPSGKYEAQPVRIAIANSAIASVEPIAGGASAQVALEPELLTSILSDQLENRRPVR